MHILKNSYYIFRMFSKHRNNKNEKCNSNIFNIILYKYIKTKTKMKMITNMRPLS